MLRLQLLGGLNITLDDQPVTGFISSKAQALLCYLAINHRQSHLRSSLAALFWGDMPDEDAATNLRQAIANLKKLLEPHLEITRQSVQFNAAVPYWLDVEGFESSGDVSLYRGDLLAGFGVADAPDFEDWLTTERERLHDLALATLRKQAERHQTSGDDVAALAALNRLVAIDPLQEDAQRHLMRLLAMNGQRGAALTQYETCAAALRRELDIEPEVETVRLFERIRSAQRWINLPTETTPFIGRDAELSELTRRLADPTCHFVTIAGLGGIGKTRLALRLAHRQASRMLHGAVMVNLTAARTLDSFLSILADALHFPLLQLGTPRAQLLDYLREKHLLILLDNIEQLAGVITDFLNELIQTAPEVRLVATSRQRLNLRGEWVLALDGLPFSAATSTQVQPPAQALFLETARRVRGDDLIQQEPPEAIARICALVQGMPLAIELAAAWSRLLTCDELAQEIASNLTALETTTQEGEERHRSLRAVFDHSWQLFSPQEQRVLTALSAFASGFTRDAAQTVAGASLPVLLGLADKMLLRREADGRFSLHEMIRQYLVEKLPQSAEVDQVRSAYLTHFTHFLQSRAPRLKTAEQQSLLVEITRDIDNIHLAWETAIQFRDRPTLAGMLPVLSLFHDLKCNWRVALALLQSAESALDPADTDLYGAWLSQLALAASRVDQPELTKAYAERCLELLSKDQPSHQASIARTLLALSHSEGLRGAYEEAIVHLRESLALRQHLGDEWDIAQCFMRLGSMYGQQAQYDVQLREAGKENLKVHLEQARAMTEQGFAISQRLGEQFLTARFQTALAVITQLEGHVQESEDLHRASLTFYEAVGSLDGRCMAMNGLGGAAHLRQDFRLAVAYFSEALALSRQIGARQWEANALTNLAICSVDIGELRPARSYFQQSQAVFRALGHEQYVAMIQSEIDDLTAQIQAG